MEQFRTELTMTPKPMIHHGLSIVTTGSCFSENIGQKLAENKFKVVVNPLGTCYNPISIHKGLMMREPDEDLFVQSEGVWRHFDFHSKFFADTKDELRTMLNKQLERRLHDLVIITYGTTWVYRHKATNKIVANCHKRPQSEFEKVLLTTNNILESFAELRGYSSSMIMVTLSPVRHVKDTLELNSVSKSVMRSALHEMVGSFSDVEYFPAYEIMMDDLRDYRFYERDLIHPSDVAIDYIWNKFSDRYFSSSTKDIVTRWQKVLRSLNHRAFNTKGEQYKVFMSGVLKELEELSGVLDVSREMEEVKMTVS